MKATATEQVVAKYPYLGRHVSLFVLFTAPGTGTVVCLDHKPYHGLGVHGSFWNESIFTRLEGTTLQVVEKGALPDVYPCLKKWALQDSGSFVVLFTSRNEGIVVQSDNGKREIGEGGQWCEEQFEPFHGSVVLEAE